MARSGTTRRRPAVDPAEPTVSEVLQPGAMRPPLTVIDPDSPRSYEDLAGLPDVESTIPNSTERGGGDKRQRTKPTPKQHAFIVGCLKGLTASESYRRAYDCENSSPGTIWTEASKLMCNPAVAQRLAEGWRRAEEAALVGAPSLRRLTHQVLVTEAQTGDTSSARIAAAVKIGQLAGVRAFEEGTEESDAISATDVTAELRARLAAVAIPDATSLPED